MADFYDIPRDHDSYLALPPLVPKGTTIEQRDAIIGEIIEAWSTPLPVDSEHEDDGRTAYGVTLNRVRLWDDDRDEAIDLRTLIEPVCSLDEPPAHQRRVISMRGCWIPQCSCAGLGIHPLFQVSSCSFGEGAILRHATFGEGAILGHATFGEGANLMGATFGEGANLGGATFHRASFLVSDGKSRIADALLPFYTPPYILDRTGIEKTVFHLRARDPWSVLRRNYTGSNMVFVLMFTLAAFLPVIGRALLWTGVSRVQEGIPTDEVSIDLVPRRVIEMVLSTSDGWLTVLLSIILLSYNVARAYLTYRVGPLRDHVDQTGVSPAWADYKPLWRLHQIASPILAISIIYGVYRIVTSLWSVVWVPA